VRAMPPTNAWDHLAATAPAAIPQLAAVEQREMLAVPALAWRQMQTELCDMRRFVRSMLAVEARRRAANVIRVQARWRGMTTRQSLDGRLLRARLRLRWLTSIEQLSVSAAAARPLLSFAGGRLHAAARGFLVRRRVARYSSGRAAACLLQAAARGRRDRRALRLPLAQHRRTLRLAAELAAERRARLAHEGALRTMYAALRELLARGTATSADEQHGAAAVDAVGTAPRGLGQALSGSPVRAPRPEEAEAAAEEEDEGGGTISMGGSDGTTGGDPESRLSIESSVYGTPVGRLWES